MSSPNSLLTMLMLSAGGVAAFEFLKPTKLEEHTHKEGSHAQAEDDTVPFPNVGPRALSHLEDMSAPTGTPSDSTMKKIRKSVKDRHRQHELDHPVPASVKNLANGTPDDVKRSLGLWGGVVDFFEGAMSYILPADKPSLDVKETA